MKLDGDAVFAIMTVWQDYMAKGDLTSEDMRTYKYRIYVLEDSISITIATKEISKARIQIDNSGIYEYILNSSDLSIRSITAM